MDLALNYLQWLICHKTKPDEHLLNICSILRVFIPASTGALSHWSLIYSNAVV